VVKNAGDDSRVGQKGEYDHGCGAPGTGKGVDMQGAMQQGCPALSTQAPSQTGMSPKTFGCCLVDVVSKPTIEWAATVGDSTMKTIRDILSELAAAATDHKDKGDKFERLMKSYFKTDPLYIERFSDVWLWSEWPGNGGIVDTGIDIVCQERNTDGVCAVQCKFFNESYTLEKADIDSFFTASGKYPFTSRIIISTTDRWRSHAEEALENQQIPVTRIRVQDLDDSAVDWNKFSLDRPEFAVQKPKKKLKNHQIAALDAVKTGFQTSDRGKMIMACGTGKTFTSLKIAEELTPANGMVLFCVPSISLMSQTLKEWVAESHRTLRCFAVCSDTKVGKKHENEDIRLHDLAFPATTDAADLFKQVSRPFGGERLTVIFSTYQSIQVIADAQKAGLAEFDLIICDEAHRTTGVTLADKDESNFVMVHNQLIVRGKKRLYMTATPRLYSDDSIAKLKAKHADAVLCSMDDERVYGPEFHNLTFSEAVGQDLLSDYKVLVLVVDKQFVSRAFQRQIADRQMSISDAGKIVGCWNGLSKRRMDAGDAQSIVQIDPAPMRRAVGFVRSIKDSKHIANLFQTIIAEYRGRYNQGESFLECEANHVDGTFNVLQRNEMLDWLKETPPEGSNVCRILTNARCLSEGVDVPALDAVIFFNPRDSKVDVIQSVGRVMRKAPNKTYGYVILPVVVPTDVKPEDALNGNKDFEVVWDVLQALRAHDDKFNMMINKIDLNQARDSKISIIGIGGGPGDGGESGIGTTSLQQELDLPFIEEYRDAIYTKIVQKCGDRRYWEDWAKDIAEIAQAHVNRINNLLTDADSEASRGFADFVAGLRENLNPSVTRDDAVEMLAQHLITKPVFDALFENYSFAAQNAVSVSMQRMLDQLQEQSLENETETLNKFYDSVRKRASGIDNQEGKQKIMVELYDKFFRSAFPKMSERLGIVYTPIEVVDFIINSADWACRKEFGYGLTDKGVHILDPFTGTGTFMVRLLQSGLIKDQDLRRKYMHELHANEIVLLAYYIAAINIEETFHYRAGGHYEPFSGIVLTDTFQMAENATDIDTVFPENNRRAAYQRGKEIRVIIGNPPYSAGQTSANDANQNLDYPKLNSAIRDSYAKYSTGTNKNSLYDSYIQAFRWASDRIKDCGIVCYVSNGAFIDSNSADGFRACLAEEFSAIYCFNLRGNCRTQGEQRRKEKGNVFGEGSRTPIAITLLVKNPSHQGPCEIHYHDIGDYLSREEKLSIISTLRSMENIPCVRLEPNDSHDWINQRDPVFASFTAIGDKAGEDAFTIFATYSNGLKSNRDAWVYNFSRTDLNRNMAAMIDEYMRQRNTFQDLIDKKEANKSDFNEYVEYDARKISWNRSLLADFGRQKKHRFCPEHIVPAFYRPYCREWLYFDRNMNDMVYRIPTLFPTSDAPNLIISIAGLGVVKEFSAIISGVLPDVQLQANGQNFPLYYYEKTDAAQSDLLTNEPVPGYTRKDAITAAALKKFRDKYGKGVTKEDIFFYVYGILHSPEYKQRFASDLKKMLPRIPFTGDFWAFSKAGRELAAWHLNYEKVEPYPVTETADQAELTPREYFRVAKMTFGKMNGKEDRTIIQYNARVRLSGIPLEAYDYIVNGKSALDWIMERYQVKTDPESGIVNDPNDWSEDPRYIVDLVKRIVRVSLETVRIVKSLPPLNEQN